MNGVLLNQAQKEAVEHIYGPLLVLAGPGTGKTQLLSARITEILQKTDASPRNILCLTFTESGAHTMRERLRSMIGDAAYEVTISTYHSFGSEIISQYPEFFQTLAIDSSKDVRLERPIDELAQVQIISTIIAALPFDDPLIGARYYVKSVLSILSDLKRHLISPTDLRELAAKNLQEIDAVQPVLDEIVNSRGGFSRKKAEKAAQYAELLEKLATFSSSSDSLIYSAAEALKKAHEKAAEKDSPTPLTDWKNEWLYKDENDAFTLTEKARSEKLAALASVYERYQQTLIEQAAYDFDDMILRAIEAITEHDELRFNLQERYQFILLDEFQDTNPSQFELVKKIADHPVHEGQPNIMAVGDDDQAIFAFQGAHVGNMKHFTEAFREVKIVNLTENYRSHPDILHIAHNVAAQIEDRLHTHFEAVDKVLIAASKNMPAQATIARHDFAAEASECAWIAKKIATLIQEGVSPTEIAVLAPKHKILERLVPFLQRENVPVSYEKRENILETEIVQLLKLNAQLLQALLDENHALVDHYLPLVLNMPYWQLPIDQLWAVNWQKASYDERRSWAEIALTNETIAPAVQFYLTLSAQAPLLSLEKILDILTGSETLSVKEQPYTSPLKAYYFSQENRQNSPLAYYEAITHLSVIRAHLRSRQAQSEKQLTLADFITFFDLYEAAELPLINSHPIAQSTDAVQLMTAYKAKGMEFDYVFIPQALDDIWGKASKNNSKLALPPNLTYIRYIQSSDDERRRLFFVALTRARHGLYITAHTAKDTGKQTTPLQYLAEANGISAHLPAHAQSIIHEVTAPVALAQDAETLWQAGQVVLPADFRSLLADRLTRYTMSPTHLNSFTDLEHAGPETFLIQTLLRFPQAPTASGEYGTAVHQTLEWYQQQCIKGVTPTVAATLEHFRDALGRRMLTSSERTYSLEKGSVSLKKYLTARAAMFKKPAKAEVAFHNEGVVVNGARLGGKIDRLEIDEANKTLSVVDYKTGKPLTKWGSDMKSLKYKQQLYFYKWLLEGSSTWKGYTVTDARLEFIEPDKQATGDIVAPLYVAFNPDEENDMKQLCVAVWQRIQSLDLPDVSSYSKDFKGSKAFIADLVSEK